MNKDLNKIFKPTQNVNQDELLDYLDGQSDKLSARKTEEALIDDEFLSDAFDGLQLAQKNNIDFSGLKAKLDQQSPQKKIKNYSYFWAAAASILIIFSISIFLNFGNKDLMKEESLALNQQVSGKDKEVIKSDEPSATEGAKSEALSVPRLENAPKEEAYSGDVLEESKEVSDNESTILKLKAPDADKDQKYREVTNDKTVADEFATITSANSQGTTAISQSEQLEDANQEKTGEAQDQKIEFASKKDASKNNRADTESDDKSSKAKYKTEAPAMAPAESKALEKEAQTTVTREEPAKQDEWAEVLKLEKQGKSKELKKLLKKIIKAGGKNAKQAQQKLDKLP